MTAHPATKKRGGDPDVKHTPQHEKPDDTMERKLEEGLEESQETRGPEAREVGHTKGGCGGR